MFANLKNKIFEEVKASPSKFQQLAQAAQAAVSSSSTSSEQLNPNDGNFFTITEEDTPQNSPQKINKGAQDSLITQPTISNSSQSNNVNRIHRIRKLSNASIASDISFRLPSYESSVVYHLQSDADISGSEHEDSMSTTNFDVISKEKLHDAYRRALDRYQKYRSRYTDLANKYKELERDCTKARTVLVDTQDKAIRRINELREQCNLEQQAKAHLEEALRIEMDDMQCKIKSYETKLMVNENNTHEDLLINLDKPVNQLNLDNLNTNITSDMSTNYVIILKEKNEEIGKLELCLKEKNEELELIKIRDEENSIQLANKKLEIYSELENKEKEINDLKSYRKKYNDLHFKFQQLEKDNILLKKQSNELSDIKEKLKHVITLKQEFEAKVISHDHIINEVKKSLKEKEESLENLKKSSKENIKLLENEYETKIKALEDRNIELNAMIGMNNPFENHTSDIDNELQNIKLEKNIDLQNEFQSKQNEHKTNQLDEAEKLKLQKIQSEIRIKELEKHLQTAEHEIKLNKEIYLTELNSLKSTIDKLNEKILKDEERARLQIISLQETVQNTEEKYLTLQIETSKFEVRVEKEKADLNNQITNILSEISSIQQQMNEVRTSHSNLENEKQILEEKIEHMHRENSKITEGNQHWQTMVEIAENKLEEVEQKLQAVECENKELAEKNSLLEVNSTRLEELIHNDGKINEQESIKNELSDLRFECQNYKNNIKKLEEQLLKLLSENSNLNNAKQNIEHELYSTSNLCEEKDKEKLTLTDINKNLEKERKNYEEQNKNLLAQIDDLNLKLSTEKEITKQEILKSKEEHDKLININNMLQVSNSNLLADFNLLKSILPNEQLEDLVGAVAQFKTNLLENENKLKNLVEECNLLKKTHSSDISKFELMIKSDKELLDREMHSFNANIKILKEENSILKEQNDIFKKELNTLNNQNQARLSELEILLKETKDHNYTLQQSVQNATDVEKKLQNYEQLKIENEYLNTLTNQLETDLRKQKEIKSKLEEEIEMLKSKFQSQQCELYALKTSCENLNCEILEQNEKIKTEKQNNEKNIETFKLASSNFTSQNEKIQKDLKVYQQKVFDAEKLCSETRESCEQVTSENVQLKIQLQSLETLNQLNIDKLKDKENSIAELTVNLQESKNIISDFENVYEENEKLKICKTELEILNAKQISADKVEEQILMNATLKENEITINVLKTTNESLKSELENLKLKSTSEISKLNKELEELSQNSKDLQEKLFDFDNLKEQAVQVSYQLEKLKVQDLVNQTDNQELQHNLQEFTLIKQERDDLEQKLNKIMHEVQDVSNRNLFLEQKCENYLILEQSNERFKLANEKLSRQLDETLVSIHHNEGIQANTEFEYLKNIMFQYLTGKINGNNETLVKVIAAVLKFSPQQTQIAIEKEHHRHSLLGQINNLI